MESPFVLGHTPPPVVPRFTRTDRLLLAGMVLGAVLAAYGLLRDTSIDPRFFSAAAAPDVAATVGGRAITLAQLDAAVALLERDRERTVSPEERRLVLERLIDEELLVQRGLALGLVESDRKLRGDLVSAVMDAATAEARTAAPAREELVAFFEERRTLFGAAPPLRVAEVFVAGGTKRGEGEPREQVERRGQVEQDDQERQGDQADAATLERARAAAERLRAGDALGDVRRELGDESTVGIPDTLLPIAKLRDYIGGSAAERAATMQAGEVSEPLATQGGYRVLLVLERGEANVPSFEELEQEVLGEYRRRAADRALREYLDSLRRGAGIAMARGFAMGQVPPERAGQATEVDAPGARR